MKLVTQINSQQHTLPRRHSHELESSGPRWKPSHPPYSQHQPPHSQYQPSHPQYQPDDRNGSRAEDEYEYDDDDDDDGDFTDDDYEEDDVEQEPIGHSPQEGSSKVDKEKDDENDTYLTPLPGPSLPRGAAPPIRHQPRLGSAFPPQSQLLPPHLLRGGAQLPLRPGLRGPPPLPGSVPWRPQLPPQGLARPGGPNNFLSGGGRGGGRPSNPSSIIGQRPQQPTPGQPSNPSNNIAQRSQQLIPGQLSSPTTLRKQLPGSGSDGGGQAGKFSPALKQPVFPPKNDDSHEYEIVGSPASYPGADNGGTNSAGRVSPDKTPPVLPPRNTGDLREGLGKPGHQQQLKPGGSTAFLKRPPAPLPPHHLAKQQEDGADGATSAVPPPLPSGGPVVPPNKPPFPSGGPLFRPPPPGSLPLRPEGSPPSSNLSSPKKEYPVQAPKGYAPGVPGGGENAEDRVNLGNGETVVLNPLLRTLVPLPYFHLISRSKSKNLLERAEDGMFLVRPSTRTADPLTLSLRHSGRTYNINIRLRKDGFFALGKEKPKEMTFTSVDEMVRMHRQEPLKLQNGERTLLTTSPPKSTSNLYVTHSVNRN